MKDLGQKQCFHVKPGLWIAKIPTLCTDPQILRAFFSNLKFQQSVLTSSIKLPYLKNPLPDFKEFCIKIEMKEQPFRKYQKVKCDLWRQLVPFVVLRHKYTSSSSLLVYFFDTLHMHIDQSCMGVYCGIGVLNGIFLQYLKRYLERSLLTSYLQILSTGQQPL